MRRWNPDASFFGLPPDMLHLSAAATRKARMFFSTAQHHSREAFLLAYQPQHCRPTSSLCTLKSIVFTADSTLGWCKHAPAEFQSPAPAVEFISPAPAVFQAPAPVVEFISPALAVSTSCGSHLSSTSCVSCTSAFGGVHLTLDDSVSSAGASCGVHHVFLRRMGGLIVGHYTPWQSGRSLLHRGQSTSSSGRPQFSSVCCCFIVVREPVALAMGILQASVMCTFPFEDEQRACLSQEPCKVGGLALLPVRLCACTPC